MRMTPYTQPYAWLRPGMGNPGRKFQIKNSNYFEKKSKNEKRITKIRKSKNREFGQARDRKIEKIVK